MYLIKIFINSKNTGRGPYRYGEFGPYENKQVAENALLNLGWKKEDDSYYSKESPNDSSRTFEAHFVELTMLDF